MKEGVALSQLADILPPPVPSGPNWMLLAQIGIVCLITALILVWFIKKRFSRRAVSSAREAVQRLATLREAWRSHTISDREAAYRLAALLRLGLALPQLNARKRPAFVQDETLWRETLDQLHTLRYRNQPVVALSAECFEHTERWLLAAQRMTA